MRFKINRCRLCLANTRDLKYIYHADGSGTVRHELITTYFHPRIVDLSQAKHLYGICTGCSIQLRVFEEFQRKIVKAQRELIEGADFVINLSDPDKNSQEYYIKSRMSYFRKYFGCKKGRRSSTSSSDSSDYGNWLKYMRNENFYNNLRHDSSSDDDHNNIIMGDNTSNNSSDDRRVILTEENDTFPHLETDEEIVILQVQDEDCESYNHDTVNISQENNHSGDELISDEYMPLAKYAKISKGKRRITENDERQSNKSTEPLTENNLEHLLAKWMPNLACVVCSETWPTFYQLREHFRHQHPGRKFYISCCIRRITTQQQLKEHLLLHNDPNSFKCSLCGWCYLQKCALTRHIAKRHGENLDTQLVCDNCSETFATQRDLDNHKTLRHIQQNQISDEFVCNECEFICHSPSTFMRHRLFHHTNDSEYKCIFCDKSFGRLLELRRHVPTHKGQNAYKCTLCPKNFQTYYMLTLHLKNEHPPGGDNNNNTAKNCKSERIMDLRSAKENTSKPLNSKKQSSVQDQPSTNMGSGYSNVRSVSLASWLF